MSKDTPTFQVTNSGKTIHPPFLEGRLCIQPGCEVCQVFGKRFLRVDTGLWAQQDASTQALVFRKVLSKHEAPHFPNKGLTKPCPHMLSVKHTDNEGCDCVGHLKTNFLYCPLHSWINSLAVMSFWKTGITTFYRTWNYRIRWFRARLCPAM